MDKNLTSFTTQQLIEELAKRRKDETEAIIKEVKDRINILEQMGWYIRDMDDIRVHLLFDVDYNQESIEISIVAK